MISTPRLFNRPFRKNLEKTGVPGAITLILLLLGSMSNGQDTGSLTLFTEKNVPFTIRKNWTLHNDSPKKKVSLRDAGDRYHDIEVKFPKDPLPSLRERLYIKAGKRTFYLIRKNWDGTYEIVPVKNPNKRDEPGHPFAAAPPQKKEDRNPNGSTPTKQEQMTETADSSTASGDCSRPMKRKNFTQKKAAIASKAFPNKKLEISKKKFRDHCLSVEQVKQIMALFHTEKNRLAFAKFAYNRTTNKGRFSMVFESLELQSSEKALKDHMDH